MKHMKKLLALLLAVVMVFSLSVTAFAAGNDGSITIRNATVGEEYTAYKIFDLTYQDVPAIPGTPAQGTEGEEGYVPAVPEVPARTLVSYTYTATGDSDPNLVAMLDEAPEGEESSYESNSSPFTLTALGNNKYTVSLKDDATTGAAIVEWLEDNWTFGTAAGTETATSSEVKFTGLAYGYYYIESSLGATVTIDSTLKDVTVIDKNQGPSWDNNPDDPDDPDTPDDEPNPGKVIIEEGGARVTENSANYGEIVTFNISVNAKAWVGEKLATYYYITDTLGAGFNAAENIVVKVYPVGIDGKYDSDNPETLTKDVEYTLTKDGNSFQITVPFGEKYGSEAKIEVEYTATVKDVKDGVGAVVIAGDGNPNTANFTYDLEEVDPDDPEIPTNPDDDDPDDPTYPDPTVDPEYDDSNKRTTTTYVYAIGIQKTDEEGNPLTGATFSVKKGDVAITGIADPDAEHGGVYWYSTGEGAVSDFEVGDDGTLVIMGLDEGTYSITEEVAPLGYNKLTGAVAVEAAITATSTYTTTYYYKDGELVSSEESATATQTYEFGVNVAHTVIENHFGTELPSTGGMGTTLFITFGALVMLGAGVFFVTNQRMRKEGY